MVPFGTSIEAYMVCSFMLFFSSRADHGLLSLA